METFPAKVVKYTSILCRDGRAVSGAGAVGFTRSVLFVPGGGGALSGGRRLRVSEKQRVIRVGSRELGHEPTLVGVLAGPQMPALARKGEEEGAHILEVRADSWRLGELQALTEEAGRVREVGLPLILTVRHRDEGALLPEGEVYEEEDRLRIFEELLPFSDAIDIELSARGIRGKVIEAAKKEGKTVIVSHHDFAGTPPDETLARLVGEAREIGGDLPKIAARANEREDVARLFAFAYRSRPVVAMSMGPLAAISRTLGFLFGSCLTYGHLGTSVAPGQPSVAELRSQFASLFPSLG